MNSFSFELKKLKSTLRNDKYLPNTFFQNNVPGIIIIRKNNTKNIIICLEPNATYLVSLEACTSNRS